MRNDDFIKPMLAHRWQESLARHLNNGGYVLEPKLDGNRCLKAGSMVYSRLGNLMHIPWLENLQVDAYLDGEIVVGDNDVCHCTGLDNEYGAGMVSHYRAEHKEALEFRVFDVLACPLGNWIMDWPYAARRMVLETVVLGGTVDAGPALYDFKPIGDNRVVLNPVYTDGKASMLSVLINVGYEGGVLKRLDSRYSPHSRGQAWIKFKPTDTYFVVAVDTLGTCREWTVEPGKVGTDGVLYPEGKHTTTWEAGWIGLRYGVVSARTGSVEIVGQCLTGPPEELEPMVGKVLEVKAWGQHASGALKHPQFVRVRDDKELADCKFQL